MVLPESLDSQASKEARKQGNKETRKEEGRKVRQAETGRNRQAKPTSRCETAVAVGATTAAAVKQSQEQEQQQQQQQQQQQASISRKRTWQRCSESVGERGNVGRLLCNTRQRRQATQEVLIFYEPVRRWVNVCESKAMQDDAIEMANQGERRCVIEIRGDIRSL
ncbi:hypothetical protein V1478_018327, partial [Vespula squamosa]